MVFNSVTFLVFFILFFQVYWWLNNKASIRARNVFTLIASYVFYGWWDWRFLGLLFISTLADYWLGLGIQAAQKPSVRRLYMALSLTVNLGILGFFKYYNFFVGSFVDLLHLFSLPVQVNTLYIILPVGISFYTFQTLSYTLDIYRRRMEPTRDWVSFFTYVAFFPQLVAGPIERASHLLKQFYEKKAFRYNDNVSGLRIILWGMFKKVVIADNFGLVANEIFRTDADYSGITVAFGALLFAFQIYCDFSGYSDIAIGISKMLGYDLMVNFRTPYFSRNFTEFWRRWHISLSTWFRDYIYIPLGGNRKGKLRADFNIFFTFVLSGLWHGANFTFITWGALHGILLVAEKRFRMRLPAVLAIPVVFCITCLLWIPFRAENTAHLVQLCAALFSPWNSWHEPAQVFQAFHTGYKAVGLAVIFILFMAAEFFAGTGDADTWISRFPRWTRYIIYYSVLLMILLFVNFNVKPDFIYFQF